MCRIKCNGSSPYFRVFGTEGEDLTIITQPLTPLLSTICSRASFHWGEKTNGSSISAFPAQYSLLTTRASNAPSRRLKVPYCSFTIRRSGWRPTAALVPGAEVRRRCALTPRSVLRSCVLSAAGPCGHRRQALGTRGTIRDLDATCYDLHSNIDFVVK